MIETKQIKKMLKRCLASEEYNEIKFYLIANLVILFIYIALSIFPLLASERPLLVNAKFMIILFALFYLTAITVVIYCNEYKKFHSVRIITWAIDKLKYGDWNSAKELLISKIDGIHPVLLTNAVTLYLMGILLLKEGHSHESKKFLSKAQSSNLNLQNTIILTDPISDDTSISLLKFLAREKTLKKTFFFRRMWETKIIRYPIVFLLVGIIFLHFINQLLKI